MTFYNAIILDKKEKIVGRTHITNLSRFTSPSSKWTALHEGAAITDNIPFKLIGPRNPITIMQRPCSDNHQINVEVEVHKNGRIRILPFTITAKTTVKMLRKMIENKEGISSSPQRIIFNGIRRCNDERLIRDLGVMNGGRIEMVEQMCGGGCMQMIDLEGATVTGTGKTVEPNEDNRWKTYSFGLNIIGKCTNKDCKSRKSGYPPVLSRELSYCHLTGDNPLDCPACKRKTFEPANFLVIGARSAINFRKTGEIQIKSTLLESPGPSPKYAKFAESNDKVKYDEIEVKTTSLDGSPFFCNFCATFIMHRSSEAGQSCGHYFHKKCSDRFKECPICSAELLIGDAVEKLFEL